MRRGRQPHAQYLRYYTAGDDPAVYLVAVGDETVKVGRSANPVERLKQLHKEGERTGNPLGEFRVFPSHARLLSGAELRCIEALCLVGSPLPGRREYFAEITLDQAAEIVGKAVADFESSSPSLKEP